MSTEIPYHFAHLLTALKNLFEVWFFTIFYVFFSHVYSPRQGQTTQWGQNIYHNRKAFFLCPYVASFKMIFSKSDFIHFFNDFIHVNSFRARAKNPLGTNFWSKESPYHFDHLLQVSNKSLLILILYTFFNVFPHVYSPRSRGRQPFMAKILMSTERPCHFAHLLQVSKKYLWSLILYIFLPVFIHAYSPRAGADNPLGSEFLF